jgi:hypothetical protein
MPNLRHLAGSKIRACITAIDGENILEYTLHGVETSGLWIGGSAITEYFMEKLGHRMLSKTPVIFVPFHEVVLIIGFDEGVALSERVLEE